MAVTLAKTMQNLRVGHVVITGLLVGLILFMVSSINGQGTDGDVSVPTINSTANVTRNGRNYVQVTCTIKRTSANFWLLNGSRLRAWNNNLSSDVENVTWSYKTVSLHVSKVFIPQSPHYYNLNVQCCTNRRFGPTTLCSEEVTVLTGIDRKIDSETSVKPTAMLSIDLGPHDIIIMAVGISTIAVILLVVIAIVITVAGYKAWKTRTGQGNFIKDGHSDP